MSDLISSLGIDWGRVGGGVAGGAGSGLCNFKEALAKSVMTHSECVSVCVCVSHNLFE